MSMQTTGCDLIEWGLGSQPMAGETMLGDGCKVFCNAESAFVVVVDALGHGEMAAFAAQTALETVQAFVGEPLVALFERCHEALKRTRGVAMSAAIFNSVDSTISWLGVGNVEGAIIRLDGNENGPRSFVVRGGVVGYQLPRLQVSRVPIAAGDSLVIATDGLVSGFLQHFPTGADPQEAAHHLLNTCAKTSDDALVLVARYRGVSV